MNSNKHIYTKTVESSNLIGDNKYRQFIELQALLGFAQRGGVKFPYNNEKHSQRLVSDVNILSSQENKQLIFSEIIYSN